MQKDDIKNQKEKLTAKCCQLCTEVKKDPKQLIVGAIILVVALLLLFFAFKESDKPQEKVVPQPVVEQKAEVKEPVVEPTVPAVQPKEEEPEDLITESQEELKPVKEVIKIEPKNAVLTFTAKAAQDFDYQVFYTVEREVWFDPTHVVTHKAKAGTHKYSIVLPVKEIFRLRLDYGEAPGKVTIKDIYLTGSQTADLNDFTLYDFNQIDSYKVNKDNSLTINASGNDPFMIYQKALLAE